MELSLGAMYLGGDRCRFRVWAPLHNRASTSTGAAQMRLAPWHTIVYLD